MVKRYIKPVVMAISLLAIFYVYIHTTFPAFKNDDSPETSAVSFVLGIGHPPAYPLYTMAGKIFCLLPLGSPAFRMNLFAIAIGIVVLLLTFNLLQKSMWIVFGKNNDVLNYLGLFALAFSYIFWNQTIEAKGGIYILNLLFLSLMIYSSLALFAAFKPKYVYFMAYIYGLSLSNHWPSMIILFPVFGYVFYKHRRLFTFKIAALAVLFVILGMSPYIYLPIRASLESVYVFMARPSNWNDFWWTVMRSAYNNQAYIPNTSYYIQIKQFLGLFINNYSILFLMGFVGMYYTFVKKRELFCYLIAIFLIVTLVVLFGNKTETALMWAVDNFLMPVEYVYMIFIFAGSYFCFDVIKNETFKKVFLIGVLLCVIILGVFSLRKNNSSSNYIAYDFGNNVIKTIEPGSFFLVNGEYYGMPLVYLDVVGHKTSEIHYSSFNSLQYSWGFEDLLKKYNLPDFRGAQFDSTITTLLEVMGNRGAVYLGGNPIDISQKIGAYDQRIAGLLVRTTNKDEYFPDYFFKLYSYRGIYDVNSKYDIKLAAVYSTKLTQKGNELLNLGKYADAIIILTKAAAIWPEQNAGIIYYNLSNAAIGLNDINGAIGYLKKSVAKAPDFWPASERLGEIYFKNSMYTEADVMYELALKSGSPNGSTIIEYLKMIKTMQKVKGVTP